MAEAQRIRFHLNGRPHDVAAGDGLLTILDYIRLDAKLTGTKEGCGEGDCGACAVIVCDRAPGPGGAPGGVRVQAINACLAFLPALDGKYVLTVEGLARPGAAHPVQDAMVALHASQCGFCTPGFVVAIAAFVAGDAPADDADIHDALAGNLCRCTGYRPIVDAAKAAKAAGAAWWEATRADIAAMLDGAAAAAPARSAAATSDATGAFLAPRTVEALATAFAAHPDATLVAGATDLGIAVAKHKQRPATTIFIGAVPELRRIHCGAAGIRIGATATLSEILPLVDPLYPSLGTLLRRFGSPQIRNLATISGNLCNASPIGDWAPVLLALDAVLHLRSASGGRDLPVGAFFTGYRRTALRAGEFLEAVTLPPLAAGDLFRVYKLSKRYDQDISTVCAAIRLRVADGTIADARLAFGGMAATPARAAGAEAALRGAAFAAASIEAALPALGRDFAPLSDLRGSGAYRRTAAANLLRRFWLDAGAHAAAIEVSAL